MIHEPVVASRRTVVNEGWHHHHRRTLELEGACLSRARARAVAAHGCVLKEPGEDRVLEEVLVELEALLQALFERRA